jgi:hypothetical protein
MRRSLAKWLDFSAGVCVPPSDEKGGGRDCALRDSRIKEKRIASGYEEIKIDPGRRQHIDGLLGNVNCSIKAMLRCSVPKDQAARLDSRGRLQSKQSCVRAAAEQSIFQVCMLV